MPNSQNCDEDGAIDFYVTTRFMLTAQIYLVDFIISYFKSVMWHKSALPSAPYLLGLGMVYVVTIDPRISIRYCFEVI